MESFPRAWISEYSNRVVMSCCCVAFEGGNYNLWFCSGAGLGCFGSFISQSVSTLHSLASSRRPTRVCVRTSARCTAVSYRCSEKLDLQDQALQYLGHAGSLQFHAHRRALHRSALSASVSRFVR